MTSPRVPSPNVIVVLVAVEISRLLGLLQVTSLSAWMWNSSGVVLSPLAQQWKEQHGAVRGGEGVHGDCWKGWFFFPWFIACERSSETWMLWKGVSKLLFGKKIGKISHFPSFWFVSFLWKTNPYDLLRVFHWMTLSWGGFWRNCFSWGSSCQRLTLKENSLYSDISNSLC